MAYRVPTSRKSKKQQEGLNLIPILDSVFIFIFFLLMSTQFVKIFEISSDVPLVSNQSPPPKQDKKFSVSLDVNANNLIVSTQNPSSRVKIPSTDAGYDYESLHNYMLKLKSRHLKERQIILMPKLQDLEYGKLIEIMDAVRLIKNTDEALYQKDKDGVEIKVKKLFDKIVFGNTMG